MKATRLLFCLVLLLCCGCSMQNELSSIPQIDFESLEYHRAGNGTSADIRAEASSINGCTQSIRSLSIKADYGPFVNFSIDIKGFKRTVVNCITGKVETAK